MTRFRIFWSRLRSTLLRRHADVDLQHEIDAHLDLLASEHERRGLSPSAARAAARRDFGGLLRTTEAHRAQRGLLVDTLNQDIRYAVRALRRTPGFTIAAGLSLALGIGANTAIFSVIDAAILRPLPVRNPGHLFMVTAQEGGLNAVEDFSYPAYEAFREGVSTSGDMAVTASLRRLRVTEPGRGAGAPPVPVRGEAVSTNYFDVIGADLLMGRGLRTDGPPADTNLVVLSHQFWQDAFQSDPAILERGITLNGVPFTVAGVAREEFFGFEVGARPDLWWPLETYSRVMANSGPDILTLDDPAWLRVFVRMHAGESRLAAESRINAIFERRIADRVSTAGLTPGQGERLLRRRIALVPGSAGWSPVGRSFARPLGVLMGMVGVVLLIACANVATLLLTRATIRSRETAVRLAIGASRGRLVRQLMTESLVLAGAGGVTGLLLSRWLVDGLLRYMPEPDLVLDVRPDLRVLLFTCAVSALAAVLFGLMPALKATRRDLVVALKETRGTTARAGARLKDALIVSQVALSLVLLIGAGLMVRTLMNLRSLDLGFAQDDVVSFELNIPYDAARHDALYRSLLTRLETVPGVHSASVSLFGLLSGGNSSNRLVVPGYAPAAGENVSARGILGGPRFFETTGITLLKGRDFGAKDGRDGRAVAVIDEAMAERYFRGDPIGQTFTISGWGAGAFEIVGVASNAKYRTLRESAVPTYYAPFFQQPPYPAFASGVPFGADFKVRLQGDPPRGLGDTIQRAVRALDPAVYAVEIESMAGVIDRSMGRERLMATLTTAFGILALLLAAVGLYGVMSYAVASRTREIGIRLALGASPIVVFRMVMGSSLWRVAVGGALGVGLAAIALRLLTTLLYGVDPLDPLTIGTALVVMVTGGSLAAWIPARRAARVDPMMALRTE